MAGLRRLCGWPKLVIFFFFYLSPDIGWKRYKVPTVDIPNRA